MIVRTAARGALLLEMLVAVGLFVVSGLAISGAINQGLGAMIRDREMSRAGDLARSAMAKIEAGIETPRTLDGPVIAWEGDSSMLEGDPLAGPSVQSFDEGAPDDSGWELEILTEPSEFAGLSIISVTASRVDPVSGEVGVSHTLHQLVRLREEDEDIIGELDEMMQAAEDGRGGS